MDKEKAKAQEGSFPSSTFSRNLFGFLKIYGFFLGK